jgi:hypothetical protein
MPFLGLFLYTLYARRYTNQYLTPLGLVSEASGAAIGIVLIPLVGLSFLRNNEYHNYLTPYH